MEVTKVVIWNGVTPLPGQTFEICIEGPAPATTTICHTFDYDGETYIFTGLVPGDYVVSETPPGTEWTITGDDGVTLTVPTDGGSDSATITNTRRWSLVRVQYRLR